MDPALKPLIDWRQRRSVHTREIVRDVSPEQLVGLIDKVEAQGREIERLRLLLCALAEEAQHDTD
jgi:hypothetical protein